ncbi:MAG: hypothetical protein M1482_01245 [Chloroflexi bacterium]|nr:hypothetical protein [Chloroflexota bacterium]
MEERSWGMPRRQFLKALVLVPLWLQLRMFDFGAAPASVYAYEQGRYGWGPYGFKTDQRRERL